MQNEIKFSEISERGNPVVYLLFVRPRGYWELRAICSTEARAITYSKGLRKEAKSFGEKLVCHIEKAELNHLYGDSMLDNEFFSISPEKLERLQKAGLI